MTENEEREQTQPLIVRVARVGPDCGERKRARTAAWHAEHAAYRRSYLKRWRRLNRDRVKAYNAKRKPKGETA